MPVTQQLLYSSSEKILEVTSRFPLFLVTISFMGIYIKKEYKKIFAFSCFDGAILTLEIGPFL